MKCPSCGKEVQANSAGRLRPHAVPIEQRTGKGYQRCPGTPAERDA